MLRLCQARLSSVRGQHSLELARSKATAKGLKAVPVAHSDVGESALWLANIIAPYMSSEKGSDSGLYPTTHEGFAETLSSGWRWHSGTNFFAPKTLSDVAVWIGVLGTHRQLKQRATKGLLCSSYLSLTPTPSRCVTALTVRCKDVLYAESTGDGDDRKAASGLKVLSFPFSRVGRLRTITFVIHIRLD